MSSPDPSMVYHVTLIEGLSNCRYQDIRISEPCTITAAHGINQARQFGGKLNMKKVEVASVQNPLLHISGHGMGGVSFGMGVLEAEAHPMKSWIAQRP